MFCFFPEVFPVFNFCFCMFVPLSCVHCFGGKILNGIHRLTLAIDSGSRIPEAKFEANVEHVGSVWTHFFFGQQNVLFCWGILENDTQFVSNSIFCNFFLGSSLYVVGCPGRRRKIEKKEKRLVRNTHYTLFLHFKFFLCMDQ